jgi:hypothetical protein
MGESARVRLTVEEGDVRSRLWFLLLGMAALAGIGAATASPAA